MKTFSVPFIVLLICLTSFQNASAQSCTNGNYQWNDIAIIFENNGCTAPSCHNSEGVSELNLTNYTGFISRGIKCGAQITKDSTLVNIIQNGSVSCNDDTIKFPMNNFIPEAMSMADINVLQAWINAGAQQLCRGLPVNDGIETCASTINTFEAPAQTTLCSNASDLPVLNLPSSTLPNTEVIVELNGKIVNISSDGNFDTSVLKAGDEICYTSFAFNLDSANAILSIANSLCSVLTLPFGVEESCSLILDLVEGDYIDSYFAGIENLSQLFYLEEILTGNTIHSVQTATLAIDQINGSLNELGLVTGLCYATSNYVCLQVEACLPVSNYDINEFYVYPNPASQYVYLKSEKPFINYQVVNASGSFVQSGAIKNNRLNIASLKNGVYYLRFEQYNKMQALKFCILH